MTTQPELIRQNDLLNRLVIDRTNMEELGRVETLWAYTPAHKVLGFICKSGFLGNQKGAFNLAQIHTLGDSTILVSSRPQETDAEKVRQLESLVNCEVWSDSGRRIGRIIDYRFHLKTGLISDYLFTTGDLSAITEGIYLLPPSKILSMGRRRVLVADSAVDSLSAYREGIKRKLTKAGEVLKEEYSQVTHQAQSLTSQAKERARSLSQRAKEKVQSLNAQLRENTQHLTQQIQETSQGFVEQVKEQTQILQDQLNEEPHEDTIVEPVSDSIDDFDAIFEDWDDSAPVTAPNPAVENTPSVDEWDDFPPATVPDSATAPNPAVESTPAADEWDDFPPATSPNPAVVDHSAVESTPTFDEWDDFPPATVPDSAIESTSDFDDWDDDPSTATVNSTVQNTSTVENTPDTATPNSVPSKRTVDASLADDDDDEPWL
ncbi:PRC-barrel domain-containing protein [Leptolyngbya sp. FACHB-36]|uniref:PRC-barrel domain-containing protein n=1 Tax=Leptolyngbya sp. FACHB-36 TaxID=2692808 RepID=UPI0016805904|nr:PRC-barrel domain-containing protein [Leptolyngbya sp. FACHB-36]MBD2021508.1 PRC-barrel domain-containing protein [Leptolyngbya sp. FACHB-36]